MYSDLVHGRLVCKCNKILQLRPGNSLSCPADKVHDVLLSGNRVSQVDLLFVLLRADPGSDFGALELEGEHLVVELQELCDYLDVEVLRDVDVLVF